MREGAPDAESVAPVEALLDAVPVSYEGLEVRRDDEGYAVVLPDDERRTGLARGTAADLLAGRAAVADWYHWERVVGGEGTARRAFLRWVERAPPERPSDAGPRAPDEYRSAAERYATLREGVTREWGQLLLTAELTPEDARRYEVRHVADRGEATTDLDVYRDPLAARDLVKTDEKGRYRPLKTAPTLPTGWAFVGLDGTELVRTVEFVYPATVANWHRERRGDLDVSHYRETAARQTGIYELIEELDRDGVERLAETCCVDSQCLKRRMWDEDEETPLDVPRGDGEFPCREPCSVAISAARKFTILEGETPREYTFELTPSEKNQIEEILSAVADGRIDEIREADFDEGANRYRARYLRAKRLTDRGLSDVPTFPDEE